MEQKVKLSTVLAILGVIGMVFTGVGFLLNSTIGTFNRQNDITTSALQSELGLIRAELQKLNSDVEKKVSAVDTTVAAADLESEQVKEDVVVVMDKVGEMKEDVVEVKEEVVDVKSKVDEIDSNLEDNTNRLVAIKSALVIGFKYNDDVKLLLSDDRLSMSLPNELFTGEPAQGAALDAKPHAKSNSKFQGNPESQSTRTHTTIAEYCASQSEPLASCYKTFLHKAEEQLLIPSKR